MSQIENIDVPYFMPGRLYKIIQEKLLYKQDSLHRAYNIAKPGDIILIIGRYDIKGYDTLKLMYGTEILHIFIFYDTKHKIVELK